MTIGAAAAGYEDALSALRCGHAAENRGRATTGLRRDALTPSATALIARLAADVLVQGGFGPPGETLS